MIGDVEALRAWLQRGLVHYRMTRRDLVIVSGRSNAAAQKRQWSRVRRFFDAAESPSPRLCKEILELFSGAVARAEADSSRSEPSPWLTGALRLVDRLTPLDVPSAPWLMHPAAIAPLSSAIVEKILDVYSLRPKRAKAGASGTASAAAAKQIVSKFLIGEHVRMSPKERVRRADQLAIIARAAAYPKWPKLP